MSSEAIAIALNHSRAKGTARLVLIGIANHTGDGGSWPSLNTLARYAGIDRRQAQRAVNKLIELNEVRRVVQAGGSAHISDGHRPNLYEFLLRCPPTCDRSWRHSTSRYATPPLGWPTDDEGGVSSQPRGGVSSQPPERYLEITTNYPAQPQRPVDNFRPLGSPSDDRGVVVWSENRCPANWRDSQHEIGDHGCCRHCHQRPAVRSAS